MTAMRVAAIQHDIVWEDRAATCARLEPWLDAAAASGARLAVLSEMFAVGFSMDTGAIAEPEEGPTSHWLRDQAKRHGLWIYGSIPERAPTGVRPRNVGVLAGPEGEIHRYAKLHPFTYSGEHEHYDAGAGTLTVSIEGLRVSLFVCYDLRFADDWWAIAGDTDCYLVCANWPEARRSHWQALLVARAIENQAYVVGVNRVGHGGKLEYAGDSRIVDPMGEVLAGGARSEALLVADVDPARVAEVRAAFPFLQDRRTGRPANP
jgi:predicted amidohydrolase